MTPTLQTWRLQEGGSHGQLKMVSVVQCLSKRRMLPLCCPLVMTHPWQIEPSLPSTVVIAVSHHPPRKLELQHPEEWEVLQWNGQVRQLALCSSMLLAQYSGKGGDCVPHEEILHLLCASCRAQLTADLEYCIHWSRHLLASIRRMRMLM
jgi:hypothetical protein